MLVQSTSSTTVGESEMLKIIISVITLVLSIINLGYAIAIFRYKNKKDDHLKAKDLRIAAFNNLIIAPNLSLFFEFFTKIEDELQKLLNPEISDKDKQLLNQFMVQELIVLRLRLLDLFRAISYQMYDRAKSTLDNIVDDITNKMFDESLNLSNQEEFREHILGPLSMSRTAVLTQLVAFDGSEDPPSSTGLSVIPKL